MAAIKRVEKIIEFALMCLMVMQISNIALAQGDGGKKVKRIPVEQSSGTDSGHNWVDLGLSVKWATCNVGATSPSDYGFYFAWGEIHPKAEYAGANCKTYKKNIGSISGNRSYDAARANWGGRWRIPTKSEFDELDTKCTWRKSSQGGKKGYEVIGPNGNSIFLPAAGYRSGTSLKRDKKEGYYWSSTRLSSGSEGAYRMWFNYNNRHIDWRYRYRGLSIRPVME